MVGTDTATGARRHVPMREPEAWGSAVFAEVDDDTTRVYLLGGIDPETGCPERGLVAYRFYLVYRAALIVSAGFRRAISIRAILLCANLKVIVASG